MTPPSLGDPGPTRLTPLTVEPGPGALTTLPALEAALGGRAPVLPLAPGGAPAPTGLTDGDQLPEDLAVVVATSGTTGEPKQAMLTAGALLASAAATHARLGGPGQWVLALPGHHVAGLQVLVRSLAAGTTPVALDPGGLTPFALVQAVASMTGARRYASLVPTQLVRLAADPVGLEALRRLDAVLVGGAASDPALLQRVRAEGVRAVTTYGMSETAGGCVYDGRPLDGVAVRADPGGRLHVGGPTLAEGYLGRPGLTRERFVVEGGSRWFVTDDLGSVETVDGGPEGAVRVRVHGRADDVITTGGLKVEPQVVEAAVRARVPAVTDVLVVGVPDPEWGEAVALVAVTSPGGPPPGPVPDAGVGEVRAMLREHLPAHALPRRILVVPALPLTGPGKPDRGAARRLAAGG